MQIFIIAMVIALFAFGETQPPNAPAWQVALAIILPKIVLAGVYFTHCAVVKRTLVSENAARQLRILDWSTNFYRWANLFSYSVDLRFGFLVLARTALGGGDLERGDWILIDELLVTTPPILMMIFGWWCYYPIDRRMREAAIMRQVDAGEPVYPIWSLSEYLISQIRHQIALMAVPLLFLLAWTEFMNLPFIRARFDGLSEYWLTGVLFAGAAMVFLFAPLMIRMVWDTIPLPHGELRQRLEAMCRRHNVGVRQLLIWRTFGGMINACVMGILAPIRYILLTDALLDTMRDNHVEAVMAHEIAHIRRHHLFWMLIIAASLIMGFGFVWNVSLINTANALNMRDDPAWRNMTAAFGGNDPAEVLASLLAIGCWLASFGWISRRFERQADAFAVQHLVQVRREQPDEIDIKDEMEKVDNEQSIHDRPPLIDPDSVRIMTSALGRVAVLNHIPIERKSWRHGSIAWRQRYLRSLVGQPVDDIPIDFQIRLMKVAGTLLLGGLIAIEVMMAAGNGG